MRNSENVGAYGGDDFERRKRPVGRMLFWLKRQFVQDVPKTMTHCEFGCRTLECSRARWETCQSRLDAAKR